MPATIPDNFLDLFKKKSFAHLATLMPDGSPQVSPVWIDYDGTYILVNSAKGRQKDHNMISRPKVALSIIDPENPYRTLLIRGTVVDQTTDGARDHIDSLAQRYRGAAKYQSVRPDEIRVIYKIRPEHVSAHG